MRAVRILPSALVLFATVGWNPHCFTQTCGLQAACDWNPDVNGDHVITVTDLLGLLSVYADVDTDLDCVFDSQDDCFGTVDACGVCNGPGPTVQFIEEVIFGTDSVYFEAVQQWYVFTFVRDTVFTYQCPIEGCTNPAAFNYQPTANVDNGSCLTGPLACNGLSTVTFDGHTYDLVGIGDLCWFRENLRTHVYANGDSIPRNLDDLEWMSTQSDAMTSFELDDVDGFLEPGNPSGTLVGNLCNDPLELGALYNGFAAADARGLCPPGFTVPQELHWVQLETALGGAEVAADAMKDTLPSCWWEYGAMVLNSSGFSAQPQLTRETAQLSGLVDVSPGTAFGGVPEQAGVYPLRLVVSEFPDLISQAALGQFGASIRCVALSESDPCFDPDGDGVCAENEVSGCTESTATNFNAAATEDDGSCEF